MVDGKKEDQFGRNFAEKPKLSSPYFAVKVTGALFHTQGGQVVDKNARVLNDRRIRFITTFMSLSVKIACSDHNFHLCRMRSFTSE